MKRHTLQKKRRPARGRKGLTLLYSKTRRKKHRVSAGATADLGSEVPNLGVARALFIILLLHVAAIVAIFLHNRMSEDDPIVHQKPPAGNSGSGGGKGAAFAAVTAAPLRDAGEVQDGEDYYFVVTGDTYERIAENRNVDVRELKARNNNTPLRAGKILRIPASRTATLAANKPHSEVLAEPEDPRPTPQGPESVVVNLPGADTPALEEEDVPRALVVEQPPQPRPQAVRVRPQVSRAQAEASLPGQYTVKSGDTVWSIANRLKVNRSELLEANGITDPRKLRVGMTLVIPSS